jgi:hypothetical protein
LLSIVAKETTVEKMSDSFKSVPEELNEIERPSILAVDGIEKA